MARMMDIGRPTNTTQSDKPNDPTPNEQTNEVKDLLVSQKSDDDLPTETPQAQNEQKVPEITLGVEPVTETTPNPNADTQEKPRDITSYALPDEPKPKTFPLVSVLSVIGVIVVLGIVYLLVFVE